MRWSACNAAAVSPTNTAPGIFACSRAAWASRVSQSGGFEGLFMLGERSWQQFRQQGSEGACFGVLLADCRRQRAHTMREATAFVLLQGTSQAAPSVNIATDDDVFDSRLGQLAAGCSREVAVFHERSFQCRHPQLERQTG